MTENTNKCCCPRLTDQKETDGDILGYLIFFTITYKNSVYGYDTRNIKIFEVE